MDIYRPQLPPSAPPIIWGERYYMVPAPKSLWNDGEIRRGMEFALKRSIETVLEITKKLQVLELQPLLSVEIGHPYCMPPPVFIQGGMNERAEAENNILKQFAFDAYDQLDVYFGDGDWTNWTVLPYFARGDDTGDTVYIGVFIHEKFISKVIE